jgi:putative NIF3 family GTP cyclohydrolase 1 type 2
MVGNTEQTIQRVAVGCGSAGGFLEAAKKAGCDLFVTGESNLHTCYEAESLQMGLILAGHYATERFHVETLAKILAREFPTLKTWASQSEREPTVVVG